LSIRVQHAAFSLLVIVLVGCHASTPEKASDALSLIARLDQQGRYDETIRVAQDWMKKHPDISSDNATLDGQIAVAYLLKASKDTEHKEEWIRLAVAYYDKDLSVHQKGVIDLELYEVGRGFEEAGDLSATDNCLYYARAVKAFDEEVSFIQGDGYTAYGKTIPLEPVRQQNEKALERVKLKSTNAGCK
jgi:hypothetical protein